MTKHHDALLLLQAFLRRGLPSLMRRLRTWRGFESEQHADVLEDLQQELWLDCVQNAGEILALSTFERHQRWFRLVERGFYRLWGRDERFVKDTSPIEYVPGDGDDAQAATTRDGGAFDPIGAWGQGLHKDQRRFLRKLAGSATYLKNGRINCRASARSMGLPSVRVRALWNEVAEDLGFDAEHLQFWRRRLVEALLGLAADLLRHSGAVTIHGEADRRPPDPTARLHRIRRLRRRVGSRPVPADVRRVLTCYRRRGSTTGMSPRQVLEHAKLLHPFDPAVHLWMFEACLAERDHAGAALALRDARRQQADPVRVLLARARLLVDRGRCTAARYVLLKQPKTRRRDPRMRSAIEALAG